ncbi:hypothetical protein HCTV-15_gp77 [Haloarcula virus HCTV-15]|nr:hypothetical protein HCTV-6_gp77 [Haloarcula virus HCTV-6]UBF22551.1 hypothetical protein HCTV-15_gp77 [Haloarcula virus HCTV-15]
MADVPIRIPGHRLHGERQYPEKGLYHVSEDEAEQIIRGMVIEMARETAEGDDSISEVAREVLTKLEHDIVE